MRVEKFLKGYSIGAFAILAIIFGYAILGGLMLLGGGDSTAISFLTTVFNFFTIPAWGSIVLFGYNSFRRISENKHIRLITTVATLLIPAFFALRYYV